MPVPHFPIGSLDLYGKDEPYLHLAHVPSIKDGLDGLFVVTEGYVHQGKDVPPEIAHERRRICYSLFAAPKISRHKDVLPHVAKATGRKELIDWHNRIVGGGSILYIARQNEYVLKSASGDFGREPPYVRNGFILGLGKQHDPAYIGPGLSAAFAPEDARTTNPRWLRYFQVRSALEKLLPFEVFEKKRADYESKG